MRALVVTEEAGPGGVALDDVPAPTDGLLVDVHAAGVGFPDLLMSRGEFQIRQPVPFTLGWEAAGVVAAAPPGSGHEVGDRVMTLSLGAHAEVVRAVPEVTFPIPDGLGFVQAAAMPLNYLTAYAALQVRAGLRAGETVLVHGAAGGAGSAAVQVAKGLGARVLAVVSTPAKADAAREAGADHVLFADEDWRSQALAVSGGGVGVVFDPVGGDRFTDSLRSLASQGRLVVVGFAGGAIPEVAVNRLLLRNADVRGCTWSVLAERPTGLREAADALGAMVRDGHVRPLIDRVVPLEAGPEVLAALEARQVRGKAVLGVAV